MAAAVTFRTVATQKFDESPEQLVISPGGKCLAVRYFDSNKFTVFNLDGASKTYEFGRAIECFALADNETAIVSGLSHSFGLYKKGQKPISLSTSSWVTGVAISALGDRFATIRESGVFRVSKSTLDEQNKEFPTLFSSQVKGEGSAIGMSTDGKVLAVGTKEGVVTLFNIDSKTEAKVLDFHSAITSLRPQSATVLLAKTFKGHYFYRDDTISGPYCQADIVSADLHATLLGGQAVVSLPGEGNSFAYSAVTKVKVGNEFWAVASGKRIVIGRGDRTTVDKARSKSPVEHLAVGGSSIAWAAEDGYLRWQTTK